MVSSLTYSANKQTDKHGSKHYLRQLAAETNIVAAQQNGENYNFRRR